MIVAVDLTALRRLTTGVERVALQSFLSLTREGSGIDWLAFIRPETAHLIRGSGARVALVHRLARAGRVVWQQTRLPSLLSRHRADLLIAPVYTAPLRCPCPVLLVIHDVIGLERPELCPRTSVLHLRLLMASSARRAQRLAVPSRFTADGVMRFLRPVRAPVVVAPGIGDSFRSEPRLGEAEKTARALSLPLPFLLCVGRLEPKKNLAAVVRALSVLHEAGRRDLGLVLVGSPGPDARSVLRTIRESRARERIRYLPRVNEEELVHLYRLAECLVFPSLVEGFGIPPLECLASGTPAVVSRSTPSYVERWGLDPWVLPALDPETIAMTVQELLAGPEGRADARKKADQLRELTWENHARELLKIVQLPARC